MRQIYSVYKITNTLNGMLYIGITQLTPACRWSQHKTAARSGLDHPLYCAMREAGIDHFVFEVVERHLTEQTTIRRETWLIRTLQTLWPNGYNLRDGKWVDVKRGRKAKKADAA